MTMPDIGELKQISQGSIHIASVSGSTIRPASIQIANVEFPEEPYEGEYTFTPTAEAQTIAINGKVALHNITIQPIPSNYGLVAWNGSTLTIT